MTPLVRQAVRALIQSGAVHRSGISMDQVETDIAARHLVAESLELLNEVGSGDRSCIAMEAGDVCGCLVHIAEILRAGDQEIESLVLDKFSRRFRFADGRSVAPLMLEIKKTAERSPDLAWELGDDKRSSRRT